MKRLERREEEEGGGEGRKEGKTLAILPPVRVVSFSRIAAFHGLVPCFLSIAALCDGDGAGGGGGGPRFPDTYQPLCTVALRLFPPLTTFIRTLARVWLSSTASLPSRFLPPTFFHLVSELEYCDFLLCSREDSLFVSILHELIEFEDLYIKYFVSLIYFYLDFDTSRFCEMRFLEIGETKEKYFARILERFSTIIE